jgi:Family of unknown function (DUF6220)
MTNSLRAIHRYWVQILFVAVIVQIGAAGYGAFYADTKLGNSNSSTITEKQFDHGFGVHMALGYLILLGGLLLFVMALAAQLGRRRVLLTLVLPLLVFLQVILAIVGGSSPFVGIFHPLNALVILGYCGYLAHLARADAKYATAVVDPAPAAAPS